VNASEYHRAVEMSKMRQLMAYRFEDFKKDWEVCIAIAQIMSVQGESEHMQRLLNHYFTRIHCYLANNPEARPWEE
jgi:hypothetical protein